MHMQQTPAQIQKTYQNAMNQARGAAFERLVLEGCAYYRGKGIADIEKTPEPMQPVKEIGGGKFVAYYKAAAQPDFKGFLRGGRAVCFEAKYTAGDKLTQERVTSAQTQRLERAYAYGALVFVLCQMGEAYYRIPWEVWRQMRTRFGHKYMDAADAAPYRISLSLGGQLLFLEGVDDQT